MKKSIRGFTLLEVMIVLAIAAILLSLAIPSFSNLLRNNRLNTTVESFTNAVNFARTEALSKGKRVFFNPRVGTDWADGTVVWVDDNNDGALNDGEQLRIWDRTPTSQSFVPGPVNTSVTSLSFNATGIANQVADFIVCDDRTGEQGRAVSLTLGGSISTKEFTCT